MSEKKGMKCLSFQQPYAAMIAVGAKTIECRSRRIKTPVKDLVICASKSAKIFYPIPGLVYGYAIGMADIVDCIPFTQKHLKAAIMSEMPEKDCYAYILENPRMIKPQPVKASASFFYTDFTPEIIEPTRKVYEKYVLPLAQTGEADEIEDTLHMFFEKQKELWDAFA